MSPRSALKDRIRRAPRCYSCRMHLPYGNRELNRHLKRTHCMKCGANLKKVQKEATRKKTKVIRVPESGVLRRDGPGLPQTPRSRGGRQ